MEFIANHFYTLTKEFEKEKIIHIVQPTSYLEKSFFNTSYGASDHLYHRFVIDNPIAARFHMGGIYQAICKNILYDDLGNKYNLKVEEIEHFTEINIGISEQTRHFIDKHVKNGTFDFRFVFSYDNIVYLHIMRLSRKYNASAYVAGNKKDINELVYNAYKQVRKNYIRNLMLTQCYICSFGRNKIRPEGLMQLF